MTKITVDKALIEQAIEAAFSPYCAQALGILVPALRTALAKPAAGRVVCTNKQAVEPVAWEWRWLDTHPNTVTFGQWSEWKRVEPRNRLCTVEDSLNEFRAYIASGYQYELRALFTSPPPPAEVPLLTTDEYTTLAHRIASQYAHRSDPQHIAYTFLPHTLEQFARAIEQAVRQNAGLK